MKQLTQDFFIGAPEWVASASVDINGDAYHHNITSSLYNADELGGFRSDDEFFDCWRCEFVDSGYESLDWENSAIDRE